MGKEEDITYKQRSYDEISRKDESENSLSIIHPNNSPPEIQEEVFYDELDRKCTLRKSGTVDSKIILHRQRTHYKGKNIYDIFTAILGLIGILLLGIFIFICAHGGWSKKDLYDVNSGDRIAIFLLAIFIIFISFIGLLGSYTYWKPIILMTTFLSALGFLSHAYVAKRILDISRFTERNMAIPWWDTYTDEMIMSIQNEHNCCGYLNYNDRAFVTPNCPRELVVWEIPAELKYAANVEKNDSYRKNFGTASNSKLPNTSTTTTAAAGNTGNDNTAINNNQTTGTDNTAQSVTDGNNGEGNPTGGDETNPTGGDENDNGDNYWRKRAFEVDYSADQHLDNEKIEKEIELGIGHISNSIMDIPLNKREENYEEASKNITGVDSLVKRQDDQGDQGDQGQPQDDQGQPQDDQGQTPDQGQTQPQAQPQDQTQAQPQGQTQTQAQGQTQTQAQAQGAPVGCRKYVVDKVKSGITPLYIALYVFLIVYVVIFVASIIYWLDLRNEKEYNEFS